MRCSGDRVSRVGSLFVRREVFGAAVYSGVTDSFFAFDPQELETLETEGEAARPRKGGARRPRSRVSSVLESASRDAEGPVMFGRPDQIDGHDGGQPRTIPAPQAPLLVNWLITSQCRFDCVYCCARDFRENGGASPDREVVVGIAKRIVRSPCIAVVLTGGEPLLSPHLASAIEVLRGRKAIILDTSGEGPLAEVLPSLRDAEAHVRISLDSPNRKINNKLRRPRKGDRLDAQETALRAIGLCKSAGVAVSAQTVISNMNKDPESLRGLLDVLCSEGVAKWNLYLMLRAGAARDPETTVMPDRAKALQVAKQIRRESRQRGRSAPIVRIVDSAQPDSVLLVHPSGEAHTELLEGRGKVHIGDILDGADPFAFANRSAHAWRYFGWIPDAGMPITSLSLASRRRRRS